MEAEFHLAIFVAFVVSVMVYLFAERRKFERHGIIFLRRTRRYVEMIDRIARSNPVLWKRLSIIFIAIAFAGMGYSVYWLASQTARMLETGKPALSLLLPSPTGSFSFGSGYILVPLWIWLIGISLVAIPHELFHGIMARVYGIRLKSVGIAFIGPIPGAFVEPDEKSMEKSSLIAKLAVLSAGSAINITIGFAILALSFLMMKALYHPMGVGYKYLINGSSAAENNLSGIITSINGIPVRNVEDMSEIMKNVSAGDVVVVRTENATYLLEARNISGKPLLGISGVYTALKPNAFPGILDSMMSLLSWVALMEIGVGIANLMPMKPFDGGNTVDAVERHLGGSGKISDALSILVFIAIVAGFVVPRIAPLLPL